MRLLLFKMSRWTRYQNQTTKSVLGMHLCKFVCCEAYSLFNFMDLSHATDLDPSNPRKIEILEENCDLVS